MMRAALANTSTGSGGGGIASPSTPLSAIRGGRGGGYPKYDGDASMMALEFGGINPMASTSPGMTPPPQRLNMNSPFFKKDAGSNANMHAIYLHIVADALGSIGVIVSAVFVEFLDWEVVDPMCSIFISVMIMYTAWYV